MFNKIYSPYQFSVFRILFGIYLTIHFSYLIPYAGEIWSIDGILPDASLNLTYGVFPNILNYLDTNIFVTGFVALMALLSILFCLGVCRPIVAMILWYGWVCLFNRNNLISNPGIPFVGWLLLVCAVVPKGESISLLGKRNENWKMPKTLVIGAWLIMSISYTISGFDKLQSESWANGTAIAHLIDNPLARDSFFREWLLALPKSIIQIKTWFILAIELLFLPLALIPKTRKWIWLAMIFMHIGILFIVDFADLTLGMLMIHLFTFDESWLKPKSSKGENIIFFDGVCNMCNGFVNFLLEIDSTEVHKFSPLQGNVAKEKLSSKYIDNLHTTILIKEDKIYSHTDAILEIFKDLGGIWSLAYIFKLVPKFIRDGVYRFISKNRYRWFGESETCRMHSAEEKERFLE